MAAARPASCHAVLGSSLAMESVDVTRPTRSSLDAVLAEPAIAAALGEGAALFVAATAPARLIYASGALQALFGTTDVAVLAERLLNGGAPGQRRLGQLMSALAPAVAPKISPS